MNQFISTIAEQWPNYILEIFVIILGVIGAYMLNKWYENSKNNKKEKLYIQSLREDLQNQLEEIKIQISFEKPILDSIYWIGNKLLTNFEDSSPDEINKHLIKLFSGRPINIYNSTLLDMQSSGNLNLIRNDNLKNSILRFYKDLSRKSIAMEGNITSEMYSYIQEIVNRGVINIHPDYYTEGITNDISFDKKLESKFDQISFNNLIKEENLIYLKNAISGRASLLRMHLYFLDNLNEKTNSLIAQLD